MGSSYHILDTYNNNSYEKIFFKKKELSLSLLEIQRIEELVK